MVNALKVTDVPAQTGFEDGETEIPTGKLGFVVTEWVAIVEPVQPVAVAVIILVPVQLAL